MSQFISEIWASVFEPGTNRSVLVATYTSFATLQATLFALLLATRSWHFVFLSIICACLWSAVVWFVNELEAVKKVEAEAERIRELRKAGGDMMQTETEEVEKKKER
ncbi:ER protein Pkr1-domain-containing protein [Trichophaea hybrida]|nr:ER protein Pkr1-domain-containing protein [Trichophaea hybrida]